MARRLPVLLTSAKQKAEAYTVTRAERGFTVWAFLGWERGGWSRLATEPTREQAWVNVLDRLNLIPPDEKPKEVPAVIVPTVIWHFGSYDDWGPWP